MTLPNANDDEKIRELHKVYVSESAEESAAIYDGWSESYEEHMTGAGYTHPAMVAAMLSRHQPAGTEPILDAGAGTGIMGEILTASGYPIVCGFDASPGMLAKAGEKNKYQDLRLGRLGERLDYDDNQFAATTASGVFTQGHAPLDGLEELIRVTRPGGHIVFSISRTYLGDMFETKAKTLEEAGKWRYVEASGNYDSAPLSDDELAAKVYAFQVV
tara:strand:+ start:38962 stop:39609 length:648 start_codon:yes stop_codon:yes gene_type:complete